MMKAGKFSTSIRQIASMPSSSYSCTSIFLMQLSARIAAGPPIAHRYMKENLNRALTADLRTCLEYEADRQVRGAFSEDYHEAVAAFVAKRKPIFRDR